MERIEVAKSLYKIYCLFMYITLIVLSYTVIPFLLIGILVDFMHN